MAGLSRSSMIAVTAATSSASCGSIGIGWTLGRSRARHETPAASSSGVTLFQVEAACQAPWTRTTVAALTPPPRKSWLHDARLSSLHASRSSRPDPMNAAVRSPRLNRERGMFRRVLTGADPRSGAGRVSPADIDRARGTTASVRQRRGVGPNAGILYGNEGKLVELDGRDLESNAPVNEDLIEAVEQVLLLDQT